MKNSGVIALIIPIAIYVLALIGEVKCIYKAVKCNWNPVGKAEVIYTVSACTGLGAIVGWIDIKDE
jgi:hypothetical protein